ncbi:MAG TPA: hypothetical protein VMS83_06135 [Methanoregula sp.]|nr:hypothetical protein [Methanoregula sp.]
METIPALRNRQKWHIITSEEIARIRELLAGIEKDGTEQSRADAQEIAGMVTLIERRLV